MDPAHPDLQRLLRLKRHEAPPPEYFEDFLFEFHRRQRAELLRRPLWRLALDRFEGAWPDFSPARTACAGGFAVALGAAVMAAGPLLRTQPGVERAGTLAAANASLPGAAAVPGFNLFRASRSARLPEVNFDQARPAAVTYARGTRPRYVLDTQPVSYEPPSSF